jgi:hypothetical protein
MNLNDLTMRSFFLFDTYEPIPTQMKKRSDFELLSCSEVINPNSLWKLTKRMISHHRYLQTN